MIDSVEFRDKQFLSKFANVSFGCQVINNPIHLLMGISSPGIETQQ